MNYQQIALIAGSGILLCLFFVELILFGLTLMPKKKCTVYNFEVYKKTRKIIKYTAS